jgi:hypothetical protein
MLWEAGELPTFHTPSSQTSIVFPLGFPATRRAPAALSRAGMRSTARDEEGARVLISALLRLLDLSRCAFPQGGAVFNRPEALEKRLSLGFRVWVAVNDSVLR